MILNEIFTILTITKSSGDEDRIYVNTLKIGNLLETDSYE
jgi:hypothetical protein